MASKLVFSCCLELYVCLCVVLSPSKLFKRFQHYYKKYMALVFQFNEIIQQQTHVTSKNEKNIIHDKIHGLCRCIFTQNMQ